MYIRNNELGYYLNDGCAKQIDTVVTHAVNCIYNITGLMGAGIFICNY